MLLFSLLLAYVSHHTCVVLATAPAHYPFLPISLNSLDLAGVRLLSPCDSQILPKQLQVPTMQCRWWGRSQVGVQRGFGSLLRFFSGWSVEEPSWDDRGSSIWGCLLLFWFRSWTFDCTLNDVCLIYALCEVTTISQLFIPFLFITWDFVKMTLLATKPLCGYASKSCLDTWEI